MSQTQINCGDTVWCRDTFGRWLERVAVSGVEGCYDQDGRLQHDFAGIYVARAPDEDGLFWPIEDVQAR